MNKYSRVELRTIGILGLIIGGALGSLKPNFDLVAKIRTCELELPRTQNCELIAVPIKLIPTHNKK